MWYTNVVHKGMEEMARIPGLQRRRQTWFLRARVPQDLISALKKKEIIRSLETRDYMVAAKRIHLVRAQIEAEFELQRQKIMDAKENPDILGALDEHELMAMTLKWFGNIRAGEQKRRVSDTGAWTEARKVDYEIELRQEELASREEVLGLSDREKNDGMTAAGEFLDAEGITYDPQSESFRKLGHFFSKAIHDLAQRNLRELQGKAHVPNDPMFGGNPAQRSGFKPRKIIGMARLFEEYLADPGRKRDESTLKNYTIIRRAVGEVIGDETPVHEVTRDECKGLRDFLLLLPSNAFKKTKAKTLKQAIQIGHAMKLPKSADTTVNMHLQKLNAVMAYAEREGYIDRNPAQGLYVQEKVKSNLRRLPFDQEQLDKIFHAPLYTGCQNDENGYNKPGPKVIRRGRFWVPLISLWTGMRLNEICQLHVADVTIKDGVDIILIQTNDNTDESGDEEKRVKTEAGIRFVPIHPMLKRIGFLDFVEKRRQSKDKRLFPEIKPGPRGDLAHGMSKWFGRFLESIDARKSRTAFHSFRHLYRDALREAELPIAAALQLGGWSRGTTDEDYGIGLKAETLYKHICKISFPDLDLSHLYRD